MGTNERYLSAAEAAKALGVSTRALRLYEQKGLVKPARSEAGWRAYGTEALTRLHQIIALKHMGLELSAIARLLKGSLSSLDSVLALQEENLAARRDEAIRSLDLVRKARARLSSGETLSVDDLTTLTRETTMDVQTYWDIVAKADRALERYWRKHFTPEEIKRIKSNSEEAGFVEAWIEARGCLQAALKTGNAVSAAALDAARRMRVVDMRFFGGDPDLAARYKKMWTEAVADPGLAAKIAEMHAMGGTTPEQIAFLERATKALQAKEAEAARKKA